MKSSLQVFTQSKAEEGLTGEGLSQFFSVNFFEQVLFYIVVALTGLIIFGILWGYWKDRKDQKFWQEQNSNLAGPDAIVKGDQK